MISETWFSSSFLMKTVICKLAHACPFLFAIAFVSFHLLSSPGMKRSPFGLMVQALRTNTPGISSLCLLPRHNQWNVWTPCSFLQTDDHPTAACVSFKPSMWVTAVSWAGLKLQCSHTLHHMQNMRKAFTWHGWC